MENSVGSNSVFCCLPLLTLAIAAGTVIGGPCGGIRGVGSGLVLLLAALVGITSAVVGWVRLIRIESASAVARLAKIGTLFVGTVAVFLNAFFALFSGVQLIGMALMHLRGY